MKIKLLRKDIFLVCGIVGVVVGIAGGSYVYLGEATWGLAATLVGVIIVALLLENRRRVQERSQDVQESVDDSYSQVDALLSVRGELDVTEAFPATRGWAASPDFLRELTRIIRLHSPRHIVEAGSGVSTLIAALALEKYGGGRVLALENGKEFANRTREYLKLHGLQQNAKVAHSPTTEYQVENKYIEWYDIAALKKVDQIDLLVVDGPPALENSRARWPALPLLRDQLGNGAKNLLDDGDREGENQIIDDWCRRYGMNKTYIPWEKGAYLLKFQHDKTS